MYRQRRPGERPIEEEVTLIQDIIKYHDVLPQLKKKSSNLPKDDSRLLRDDTGKTLTNRQLTKQVLNNEMAISKIIMDITPTSKEVLIDIFESMNGYEWARKDGWMTIEPICSWEDITCDDDEKEVTRINLCTLCDVYSMLAFNTLHFPC